MGGAEEEVGVVGGRLMGGGVGLGEDAGGLGEDLHLGFDAHVPVGVIFED